jgi:hypothetical protein
MRSNRRSPLSNRWHVGRPQQVVILGVGIGTVLGRFIMDYWFPHATWFVFVPVIFLVDVAGILLTTYGLLLYDRQRGRRERL